MPNIAILIDAENVLPIYANQIFDQAYSMGTVVCKEIFGAAQALTNWVEPVLKYAIHPNLTIKASKGKNSSDIALVIGAMELLLTHSIDTVILASSDSDFSSLSVRLRNSGIQVIGMGMEKSNPLWRTSCSGFTVLQQPAKSAPQPAPKQPAAKQPAAKQPAQKQPAQKKSAPKQPAAQAAPKAQQSATPESRTAVVRQFIDRQLASHDGRMMVSQLISALNGLKEYKADKKDSGKKPQNYLTGKFGGDYDFEINADGASWIAAKGAAAPAEPEAPVEEVKPAAEPAEPAPATPEPAEPEAVEPEPEDTGSEVQASAPDPLAMLQDAGIEEDVAKQIVVIFTESANLREAYNRLRSTFGTATGRDYYQKVKELAAGQERE